MIDNTLCYTTLKPVGFCHFWPQKDKTEVIRTEKYEKSLVNPYEYPDGIKTKADLKKAGILDVEDVGTHQQDAP